MNICYGFVTRTEWICLLQWQLEKGTTFPWHKGKASKEDGRIEVCSMYSSTYPFIDTPPECRKQKQEAVKAFQLNEQSIISSDDYVTQETSFSE